MTILSGLDSRVSVIVRSSGERTEALCQELVRAQGVQEKQTALIREAPFARALRASYEAGIRLGRPWTLCLDADVLLLPGAIRRAVELAERQDPSVFEIQCKMLDKFFGGPRDGGIHMYRTALLARAMECVPADHDNIRPELQTLEAMRRQGFPWRRTNSLIGVHGFEQYYRDVFRTCFVQARKHQEYAGLFIAYWREQRAADSDFRVALEGYAEGIRHEGKAGIDSQQDIYRRLFDQLQITEKPALAARDLSGSNISEVVDGWVVPPVYHKYFRDDMIFQGSAHSMLRRLRAQLGAKTRALGVARFLLYVLGRAFEEVGIWARGVSDPYARSELDEE
jgi:hypothetical protein